MRSIVLSKEVIEELTRALKYARQANHRVMLVLLGNNSGNLIMGATEAVFSLLNMREIKEGGILYTYHAFYEDACARRELFERAIGKENRVAYVPYHESTSILGRTFDSAVLDLLNNLEPNDLGRLAGVVDGGGLYILLLPPLEELMKTVTRFQSLLLTPQYSPQSLRRFFEQRFFNKLYEHEGIIVYDVDRAKLLKTSGLPKRVFRRKVSPLETPSEALFPDELYKLAMSRDQIEVLMLTEKLYERPEKGRKRVIVVTADRGRGKSSVIGLGIAGLSHKIRRAKGRCRIIVTAPSEANVQELFKFAIKGLKVLGHKVEEEEERGFLTGLKAKGIEVKYFEPLEALAHRADLVAVDEAASLQVPMLFALIRRFDRIIYSSTVHGYEGAGRGFSIRFLRGLKQLSGVEVYEHEMGEPIRYAPGDPIEKWIFDTLLLDAEPAQLNHDDLACVESMQVEYYSPQLEEFFLKNEELLRQFFGIYIMAHYRNNPNDLGMMMDAPHHKPRALRLKTGKIVVSIELAEEGPLDEEIAKQCSKGAWIMGNIIPDRLIKHYKVIDFGSLRGLRIVRIATHPDLWNKGLGSRALVEVEKEAVAGGYDWIGAGFGVTFELLNFWLKNNYIPVHLSPERNPVSGEYSILVVKPLNDKAAKFVELFSLEFKRRLLLSLPEPYHDLNSKTVRALFHHTPKENVRPNLSPSQLGRLISYAWGDMTLENCVDCIVELARAYFMGNLGFLSEEEELLLITKVLQAKSWRVTCNELNLTPPQAMDRLRKIARTFCEKFYGIKDESDAESYLYLHLNAALR